MLSPRDQLEHYIDTSALDEAERKSLRRLVHRMTHEEARQLDALIEGIGFPVEADMERCQAEIAQTEET